MTNTELITKNRLDGTKIGVYFGTFAPFHVGHQQDLYRALAVNDGVVLVVSGYKGDRGDAIGLSLYKRFRYLREAFSDEPNIVVAMLNEDNIPRYPDGWKPWLSKLQGIVKKASVNYDEASITVYSGEEAYDKKFHELLPEWSTSLIKRSGIPISATMIRENPHEYWNQINRIYRRHFTFKVLVAGSASVGKTTMIKHLARSINAPFSTEYARDYEVKYNLTDDELTVDDYSHFFQGQYDSNMKEIHSPSNQGVVICDTDAMVTEIYSKMYLSEEDHDKLYQTYKNTVANEDWDLIFIIPPITSYVDDNLRNMDWESSRDEFHDNLMKEIDDQGFSDKVVLLDDRGDKNDPQGFLARYEHALSILKSNANVGKDYFIE